MTDTPPPAISLRNLRRSFGEVVAVAGVDLDIGAGEFFSMLGPSGSGKTTVLRLIAGFDEPSSGTIDLFGAPVQHLPSYDRDVNTVFQDYALFPHMTVLENVEFGLRVRGIPRARRRELAMDALARMQLADFARRSPSALSGGQRQRVALARAIVVGPKVLLLDEPLGALDRKLREDMQIELKELQRNLGITFVFVTHDQEEALTLSDRVAVFHEGRILQVDTPERLYTSPASEFVATFVGTSNVFDDRHSQQLFGRSGTHSIRPEKIRLAPLSSTAQGVRGTVHSSVFVGANSRTFVTVDDLTLSVLEPGESRHREVGDDVILTFDDSDLRTIRTDGPHAAEAALD